jgi:hypothetical protein
MRKRRFREKVGIYKVLCKRSEVTKRLNLVLKYGLFGPAPAQVLASHVKVQVKGFSFQILHCLPTYIGRAKSGTMKCANAI